MTPDVYKEALSKAKVQLIYAIKQREHWNLEIARLQQLVKALRVQTEPETDEMEDMLEFGVGLKDVVMSIVNSSPLPMSPLMVRSAVQVHGFDLSKYSNPQAMIHQTLKRLADQNHIRDAGDGTYARTHLYEALLRMMPKPSWK